MVLGPWNARQPMRHGLAVSLEPARLTLETPTGASVSVYYG